MFNEFEKEDDSWRPDEPKALTIAKKVLKWGFVAFAALFIGFLVLRVILSNPPSSMKKVVWNEKAFNAYTSSDGEFEVLKIPTSDSFSTDGFHTVYEIAYIPSIKQLQFTVRHNDRALNYIEKDYPEIRETEKNGEELYVYTLTIKKAEEETTVSVYEYTCAARFGYTYRRLIFEDIDLTGVTSVKLNISTSARPKITHQTVNIYDNSKYKTTAELPNFGYKKPKKSTATVKSGKESD